jgi:hypothetical protein
MLEQMLEKMQKDFEILHRQRCFLMASLQHLMEKDFEDPEATRFKVAIAQAMVDGLFDKGHSLSDEIERSVLISMKEMLERERLLYNIKGELNGPF